MLKASQRRSQLGGNIAIIEKDDLLKKYRKIYTVFNLICGQIKQEYNWLNSVFIAVHNCIYNFVCVLRNVQL